MTFRLAIFSVFFKSHHGHKTIGLAQVLVVSLLTLTNLTMMKVMMMLLLVSIACIVHSTVSVHAVNKVVQLSALSKRVNTFRHLWNPPTVAEKPQNRLLQNGTGTSPPTPAPEPDKCGTGIFANETCVCKDGKFAS